MAWPDLLLGCNGLLGRMGALVRNIMPQSLRQLLSIIREYLRVPLAARNRDIGHAVIEQILRAQFSINIDEHTVCGLPLDARLPSWLSCENHVWPIRPQIDARGSSRLVRP